MFVSNDIVKLDCGSFGNSDAGRNQQVDQSAISDKLSVTKISSLFRFASKTIEQAPYFAD